MVDYSSLENYRTERYRGFESLSLRKEFNELVRWTLFLFCEVLEGLGRFLSTDGDEFLGLVVIEGAVTVHLDVHKHVGLHQLGHQDGVLTNHQ